MLRSDRSRNFARINRWYYNVHWGTGFSFCLALATQVTGFGLAGLCKRILIKPASLIWPETLVTSTLLNTLHAEEDWHTSEGGGLSRYKWFLWVFCSSFVWYWLPGSLSPTMKYLSLFILYGYRISLYRPFIFFLCLLDCTESAPNSLRM
jgi:OPT oligopeptide transporter protein